MTYDAIIVGGGPAGCSAALTLRLRGKSVLVLDTGKSALSKARRVENYPGIPHAEGEKLVADMRAQARESGAEWKEAPVSRVLPGKKALSVLAGNEIFQGRTVLLATGAPRAALLPGEEALVGQGVSYCATCDGMFFRGQPVAVLGGMEEAVREAAFLAALASSVTYYAESPHDTLGLPESVTLSEKMPRALRRENSETVLTTDAGEERFACVFILRPAVALSLLLPEAESRDGHPAVDKEYRTTVPGVFAAGDAAGLPYQAAKAVGEGNAAALCMAKTLDDKGEKNE